MNFITMILMMSCSTSVKDHWLLTDLTLYDMMGMCESYSDNEELKNAIGITNKLKEANNKLVTVNLELAVLTGKITPEEQKYSLVLIGQKALLKPFQDARRQEIKDNKELIEIKKHEIEVAKLASRQGVPGGLELVKQKEEELVRLKRINVDLENEIKSFNEQAKKQTDILTGSTKNNNSDAVDK